MKDPAKVGLSRLVDRLGRADWLRAKGAHAGFDELIAPGSTKASRQVELNAAAVRRAELNRPKKKSWRRARRERLADTDVAAAEVAAVGVECALPVPLPSERVRPDSVVYASRDGQGVFRAAIIEAYGQCAVTGCEVEAVLQAAHIIPYVDARSNIVSNGLCLRADIHCLYDRNLIKILGDGMVVVSCEVECEQYRVLHGQRITWPKQERSRPDPRLMNVRHEFVSC